VAIGFLVGIGWVETCVADGRIGLRFEAAGAEFRFDTGEFRGVLRGGGRPAGLTELVDCTTGTNLAGRNGILGFYRLLDADARYPDGWSWKGGAARVMSDGAVEATWPADAAHPFDLRAVYRWRTPSALDLETTLTARKTLRRMEVFVASYFNGFDESRVFARAANGPALVAADEASGVWQVFPRDEAAVEVVRDGRWTRPPHPVDWAVRPPFAAPMGMRRDGPSRRTVLLMARPEDCFAVLTPHGAEAHRSLYLSLFGRDLAPGEAASAVVRLVVGRDMTDAAAVSAWEEFRNR
jgi:hypothetical protein